MSAAKAIKIAVTAMGGQGGGVLSGWIVKLGEQAGYIAQSTSVPGVAQRTGATIYYVELFPKSAADEKGKAPVLALMPASGDVDIVVAAEFMEAGRAIMRQLVSKQTTLIASSHRDYAIAEKIIMGDGRQEVTPIREAAQEAAGRFIEADMAQAAAEAGAVISAVLFGALAGSGALPIGREVFEETIKAGGRAVAANLRGFASGYEIASAQGQVNTHQQAPQRVETDTINGATLPAPAVVPLLERMKTDFPPETHDVIREGLMRCVDYQDVRYGYEYLDTLSEIHAVDKEHGAGRSYRLTKDAAKHLALWMSYDDVVRVADLKTRASRFDRFREDVRAEEGQIVDVSEYMHPRVEEVCDLLPPFLARGILKGKTRRKVMSALLGGGRRVPTTKLRGFFLLRMIANLHFMRRGSFRFALEQTRVRQWGDWLRQYAPHEYDFACEIAAMQRLIKGYGETHQRSLANYNRIMARVEDIAVQPNPGQALSALRNAALKDEHGAALETALSQLSSNLQAAE
ncbi:MAG: indolepyruvate oxidoreductase [Hyphococcus sp.]|nr:MAG: indolepyruvate oxidoreductase [Marinicaulis sp.]